MKRLDIRLAAQYSGIKAHTIRIWEQRYELLKPQKRAGNRREYTKEDIISLMDIGLLTKYGYAISKLARLSREKIIEITNQLSSSAAGADISINKLLTCYLRTDILNFENIVNNFVDKKGLHLTITELIVPFIERAELFSYSDRNASSHFAINIARNKIIAAIEQLKNNKAKEQTALLFLPPGQYFDLILLFLSYQLQHNGFQVIHLGSNTYPECVGEITAKYKTDACITYLSPREKTNINELQQSAMSFFNNTPLFVATAEKNNTHYNEVIDGLVKNTIQA